MMPRTWTLEEKLTALMRLPWSLTVSSDPHDGSLVAQVAGVPDAIATGTSEKELASDLWHSLSASLSCRLEHGDAIPLPAGAILPWLNDKPSVAKPELVLVRPLAGDRAETMHFTATQATFATTATA